MKWTGISSCAIRKLQTSRRAFTLTEMVLVLGVIGLVLGSLWALIAQSWENQRQEELKEEIFNTVKNIRAYYGGQSGIPAGTFISLTPQLISVNVIAGDMVRRGGAGGCANVCANHPWGTPAAQASNGSFGVCSWKVGTTTSCTIGAAAPPQFFQFFAVELQGMPLAACIKAAMLNSGATITSGLYDVYINNISMLTQGHGFPVKTSDAETNCNKTVPATLDFIYRVVQPQF